MKHYKHSQFILILTPFVFSFAFGLDIYIPIVPQMSQIFYTTPAMVQLTLSLFLLMTGLGQLFIGPLSDQWGRKRVFYLSSFFYAVGSIGCALSTTIYELIAARLVCSIGACGMLVTSFAIVRDLFSNEQSAKMYSFLNGAIGISPTLAPIIGGYLSFYFGWKSVFYFLASIGFFALFITRYFIQETLSMEKRIKLDRAIFKRYIQICSHREFMIYSLLAGLAEGVFFCFFSISPFIIIDRLGIPTHIFGYYFAIFGSVIGVGGFVSGKLIEKVGVLQTIKLGILLMFFGGVSMLVWSHLGGLSLEGFLFPMVIACTGAMFLIGSSASLALEPFPLIAGTASAAFGAIEFTISALAGSILMLYPVHSTIPYGLAIVFLALGSLLLFSLRDKFKTSLMET